MIVNFLQSLDWSESWQERQGLGWGSPIGFWVPGVNDDVQQQDDDVGSYGRAVVHEEHDGEAEEGADKWKPLVEVLEGGPPSWWPMGGHTSP